MSYDLGLVDPITGEEMELDAPHQMKGGTYPVGGCPRAHLNITWNYSEFYYALWPEKGIAFLYGKSGAESIPFLENAIGTLGDDIDPDYWKATEGNAKRALTHLLALARLRPDGIWEGD